MRLLLLLVFASQALSEHREPRPIPPVILVPGDGGSQMQAKLDKPAVVHYLCSKKTNYWYDLWLNMELLVPTIIDCWVDNMRLVYDNTTRTTSNSPGVLIRVPGFGSTETVEWLDTSHHFPTAYFYNIVDAMVSSLDYVRDTTVRGAPFDFRKAPNEQEAYFEALTHLTEDMYSATGLRVVFMLHSLGGPMLWYFLAHKSQAWKDKYVEAVISMGGAWGGSVKAVKVYAAGDNLGYSVISQSQIRKEQRSTTSLSFLLPSPNVWKEDDVLVQTPKRNFTTANFKAFFSALELPHAYEIYLDTKDLLREAPPPGVDLYCLYGHGVETVEKLVYDDYGFPDKPILEFGDGDGTVNLRSAKVCESFSKKQKQKVQVKGFQGMEHMAILKSTESIMYAIEVLTNITKKNEEAAARIAQAEALEKEREKNMISQFFLPDSHYKKKKDDIKSSTFWKYININALHNVL